MEGSKPTTKDSLGSSEPKSTHTDREAAPMSSSDVILYDLPSKQGTAWSLNPWKSTRHTHAFPTGQAADTSLPARMILNYKGIPYTTQWVEYPDLAPTLASLGLPPNPRDGPGYFADYSSPAIRYADGRHAMDSWPIAHELEKQYPAPSLHLDDGIVAQVRDLTAVFAAPLRAHMIPRVPLLLPARSAAYFHETREAAFGKALEDVAREAGEANWEQARPPAEAMGDLLRRHGGPFFLGTTGE